MRSPVSALDRLERELGAAQLVGRVDLVGAVARDLDLEVARQRHHRGGLLGRVEADQDDRVRAGAPAAALVVVLRPLVGADQHDRLRLARVGLRQLAAELELRLDRAARSRPGRPRGRRPRPWRRRRRRSRARRRSARRFQSAGAGLVLEHVRRSSGGGRPRRASMASGSRRTNSTSASPILPERADRHPLLGAVVAVAHGAELDGRHAGVEERDRVGGAVAAHRDALGAGATRAIASASTCTNGLSRCTIAGARWKVLITRASGSALTEARIASESWPGR